METSIKDGADASRRGGLFCASDVEEETLVIFGATGDLAMRKLVPALYALCRDGSLPKGFKIIAAARSDMSIGDLLERYESGIRRFARRGYEEADWKRLTSCISYLRMDYDSDDSYRALANELKKGDTGKHHRRRLYYLATPPASFKEIVLGLGRSKLVTPAHHREGPCSILVFEKPFGRDLASALELNDLARKYLDEKQIFRMDHYLGKETVQNILVFRFANAIFEPIWNRRYISSVRISAFENIGIEGRGAFYEETGVIRDVLQNHMLQILALCAMEPPISFEAEHVRDERVKVFQALRPLDPYTLKDSVSLAQYDGYSNEKGVAEGSRTPTYASLKLFVDNWRWSGVPFILSTGKNLEQKSTRIEIHYSPVPLCMFKENEVCTRLMPNVLTILVQPDEGISLRIGTKTPGNKNDVSPVEMHFDFDSSFKEKTQLEAYEKLILDCLRGNQTLFARQEEVEHMWRFVAPLIEGVQTGDIPVGKYHPGSVGPEVKP